METPADPLHRSKRALVRAARALSEMWRATSLLSFAYAWETFIERLERVWVWTGRECRPFRSRFEPWRDRFKELRRHDELLRYLYHARHADRHTIKPTSGGGYGLLPITNGGKAYARPTQHLGIGIDGSDPLSVAEKGLAFYADFLQQVERTFFRDSAVG